MSVLSDDHSVAEAARNRTFGPLYSRNAKAVISRGLMATRSSNWLVMLSGFFEPVLFLISMGVGMGAIVGAVQGPGGEQISYAAYIAPALLGAGENAVADLGITSIEGAARLRITDVRTVGTGADANVRITMAPRRD